jgi:3-oxoacyl-[acyl-carrier protein] reductase
MDLKLKGKVAIVCAASKGFGRACALALARERANVVICARNPEALDEAARAIRTETGVKVLPVRSDLNKGEDINRLVKTAIETFSTVDILVTNVGHPKMGGFAELDEEDWRHGFESILLPVIRLCRMAIPHMQTKQWGRIVHIASYAVKEPSTSYLVSGVFRTGVAALGKSLANEYGRDGILVNTVCPGLFRTPLGEALIRQKAEREGKTTAEAEAKLAEPTAVGRIGEAEELSGLVAFLCSEAASHITGQVIAVDGGKSRGLF